MPLNSFDQNMTRNADLGTKDTKHYSCKKPHTKAAEKLTRQVRFCKLRSLSILPLQTAEIPAAETFSFPLPKHLKFVRQYKKRESQQPHTIYFTHD